MPPFIARRVPLTCIMQVREIAPSAASFVTVDPHVPSVRAPGVTRRRRFAHRCDSAFTSSISKRVLPDEFEQTR
jgi:hypothetical protein